jgi:hypothetical protein
VAARYEEPHWWGGTGNPAFETVPAFEAARSLSDAAPAAENPIDTGELAVLAGADDGPSYSDVPEGCGSNPLVYIKEWQSQFIDGCSGILAILNTKFANHPHPDYAAGWRIDPADGDALWRLARRTMTAPGRVAYSVTQFDILVQLSADMLAEMQADAANAVDAFATSVVNTVLFPAGFVRVAGTYPDFGMVGSFDLARRLADAPGHQGNGRQLSGNQSVDLDIYFEVLSETVLIDETFKKLDDWKADPSTTDTFVERLKQYSQSMVFTCTISCAEVYGGALDPSNSGWSTVPYDPAGEDLPYPGEGYGDGTTTMAPTTTYGGYGGTTYPSSGCYPGCATCDGPGSEDCSSCDDGSPIVDGDGDGYGACSSGGRRVSAEPHEASSTLRRLQRRTSERAFYNMQNENDVVAFVEFWAARNAANMSDAEIAAKRDSHDASAPYLEGVNGDIMTKTIDAMSEESAMAWYRIGGCPKAGEAYIDFAGTHPYNDLYGYCNTECCGCKICEDYYAGLYASNQSFLLQEMEAYCKTHETSCMKKACNMCGGCFERCSYDETQLPSEAKALLTFVSAAKIEEPTLCKMCCHMDMKAMEEKWDGIAQCPTDAKEKARHDMGCDTWDFKVSCTCEKDFWADQEGEASLGTLLPAIDEKSRTNADFCQNAVSVWASYYHCNDVYASLSRDQPSFDYAVKLAKLEDDILTEPTPERPAPSLCDICGATCAFNFDGACMCPLYSGPTPDEKYAMFVFCGLIGGLLFIQFHDICVGKPVA